MSRTNDRQFQLTSLLMTEDPDAENGIISKYLLCPTLPSGALAEG